ncbi:MAG: hypothetical protein IKE70_02425, partial [Bacilli bacterium]|nr:hypothetical protein [Bacilli bacterium]
MNEDLSNKIKNLLPEDKLKVRGSDGATYYIMKDDKVEKGTYCVLDENQKRLYPGLYDPMDLDAYEEYPEISTPTQSNAATAQSQSQLQAAINSGAAENSIEQKWLAEAT